MFRVISFAKFTLLKRVVLLLIVFIDRLFSRDSYMSGETILEEVELKLVRGLGIHNMGETRRL